MTDQNDWCVPHGVVIKDHKIIRQIVSGSKSTSYSAVDGKGERCILTILDREKILTRAKLKAHHEGKSSEEGEEEGKQAFRRFQHQYCDIFERTKGLTHESILEMKQLGTNDDGSQLVIVSAYMPAIDLFSATRGFTPLQQISMLAQVLDGIDFIHSKKMLHLNLKPTRIWVDMEGIPPIVRLCDFGFAIPFEGHDGNIPGTPLYMPPEVALERRDRIGERTDLYSFAATAYQCLAGRPAFEQRLEAGTDKGRLKMLIEKEGPPSPPSHLNQSVPKKLDELVMTLLEKRPEGRRFASADEVLRFLHKNWPSESREMPKTPTSTMFGD